MVRVSPCRCRCCCCPNWWRECEARCCAVLAIVSFSLAVTSFAVFTDSAFFAMSAQLYPADCIVSSFRQLNGSSLCQWTSCRESCTAVFYNCSQVVVKYALVDPEENRTLDYFINNTHYIPPTLFTHSAKHTHEEISLVSDNNGSTEFDYANSDTNNFSHVEVRNSNDSQFMNLTIDRNHTNDNMTQGLPLFVNLFGCGYEPEDLCLHFYNIYSREGLSFPCLVYHENGFLYAVPDPHVDEFSMIKDPFQSFLLSLTPSAFCIICAIYIRARRLFEMKPKQNAEAYKDGKKRSNSMMPKNFYQNRLKEMDNKWQHRKSTCTPIDCQSVVSTDENNKKNQQPAFIKVPPVGAVSGNSGAVIDHEQFL